MPHRELRPFDDSSLLRPRLATWRLGSSGDGHQTVTSSGGERCIADALLLAAGSQPNFFGTPGAPQELVAAVLARQRINLAIADHQLGRAAANSAD